MFRIYVYVCIYLTPLFIHRQNSVKTPLRLVHTHRLSSVFDCFKKLFTCQHEAYQQRQIYPQSHFQLSLLVTYLTCNRVDSHNINDLQMQQIARRKLVRIGGKAMIDERARPTAGTVSRRWRLT